jgi:hypothetical protein
MTVQPHVATTLQAPVLTAEAEDVRTILGYLRLTQSSPEAQEITGLSKSAISELLSGKRIRDTARRRHIAYVAGIVKELSSARFASTGTRDRGKSAIGWLHTARVDTSRGQKSPLELLADTDLTIEALDQLHR